MEFVLAYADVKDNSGVGNLAFIAEAVGIVAGTAILVLVLWGVARFRRHLRAEAITAVAILWGVITAARVIYAVDSQMKWSQEHTLQLETGYLYPGNQGCPLRKPRYFGDGAVFRCQLSGNHWLIWLMGVAGKFVNSCVR